MTECDATLGQIVGRHFQRNLVTRQDTDVVLAHLAAGVCNQLVAVFQGHAKTRIRQN